MQAGMKEGRNEGGKEGGNEGRKKDGGMVEWMEVGRDRR